MRLPGQLTLSLAALLVLPPVAALNAAAQQSQRSSSSSENPTQESEPPSSTVVSRHGVERTGSAVTLETSETLFDIAAALNTCGYDNGLESSLPVRAAVRAEMNEAIAASPAVSASRQRLCGFIRSHQQGGAQNLAQYISLALFMGPPPELQLSVSETDMPPDAMQVVTVLPLLRDFAEKVQLHGIYIHNRAGMEAAVTQVHDSMTRLLLETNQYLQQPVSSYDGRRFLVLLEPMLSPQAVNARIYGSDYFVVTSPAAIDPANPDRVSPGSRMTVGVRAGGLQMDQVRHLYLLYNVDPIIYAHASATNRLLPILKTVSDAPIDFNYKNDVVALTTECVIKAIEARTMDVGIAKPAKPRDVRARAEIDDYNRAIIDYDRKAEAVRRHQVTLDMESGWVMTQSFYETLAHEDHDGINLRDLIGPMVYGLDVQMEVDHDKKIPFFAATSNNIVAGGEVSRARAPRQPQQLSNIDKAELALQKNDKGTAEDIAEKELTANPKSTPALYVMARAKLMEGDAQAAYDNFQQIVGYGTAGGDTRALAWSHIYLGRLYDAQQQPDRAKAVAEYKAALATPSATADVQAAANAGIQKPFAAPKRTGFTNDGPQDDEELDPTGKRQKESYKPGEAPQK